MRKVYLFLSLLLVSGLSFAQLPYSELDADYQQIDPADHFEQTSNELSSRGSATCIDTNNWALYRSINGGQFSFFTLFMENDTNGFIAGWSTFFDVPANGSLDLSGFEFYARSVRGDSADVIVTCEVYMAAPDSTPMGTALASVDVNVAAYGGNFISGFQQSAEFNNAVTMTDDFCLVMDVQGAVGDSIEILRGFTGSGVPDYPTAFRVPALSETIWYPASLFGAAGARIAHVYPYVEFTASNSIELGTDSLCEVNEEVFIGGDAPVWLDGEYWTFEAFIGAESSYWSVNGGTYGGPTSDSIATFPNPTQDYMIDRWDSLTLWNGSCIITESAMIYGSADSTNASVGNLASGIDAGGACVNGPGNTTVYLVNGTEVVYNKQIIECDPDYVSAGFYSNGTTFWQIDNMGMVIDSGSCDSVLTVNAPSKGGFSIYMENTSLVVNRSEASQLATGLTVYDLSGRIVTEQVINAGNVGRVATIDLTEQPAGLYIVKVGEEVKRVVR